MIAPFKGILFFQYPLLILSSRMDLREALALPKFIEFLKSSLKIKIIICPLHIRAEHFRSGPVLDQNKQPNRFYIFFSFGTEPNRKPVQTD